VTVVLAGGGIVQSVIHLFDPEPQPLRHAAEIKKEAAIPVSLQGRDSLRNKCKGWLHVTLFVLESDSSIDVDSQC